MREGIHLVDDNINLLRELQSEGEFVDLIYIDPPFFTQKDWGEFDDRWASMDEYINTLKERIILMKNILKPTGSFYLHCDPTASHYIKIMLDYVFGQKNFRNEIVWHYGGTGRPNNKFNAKHDIIFFYAASDNQIFNPVEIKAAKKSGWTGKDTKRADDVWKINTVFQSKERGDGLAYPTRKPLPLLERIIKASSNEGDLVADFYAGCGTSMEAADKLNRRWLGCDINPNAVELTKKRINYGKRR